MKKLTEKFRDTPFFFKFDLKMKLTAILSLAFLLNIHANSFSQKDKVTLNVKDATVLEVIDEIESSTDFRFIYKIKEVQTDRKVSASVEKAHIEKVLTLIFPDSSIEYRILDKQIILRRQISANITPPPADDTFQKQLTGVVKDENGVAIFGVNVLAKGTTIGTATDFDGRYAITLPSDANTLVFSYVGYFTQEISVNDKDTIDVVLKPSSQELYEVVVQAYRNTTTKKNSAAISKVSSEVIENKPNASAINSLQARVAGLNISTGNGQPGASSSVIIRGVGSINGQVQPLYIIDGTPVNSDDFRAINPNDIESVSVLKDAAAAGAYGNRGANGVVVITTKKGTYKAGLDVSYSESYGRTYQQDNNYGLMNSRDLLNLQKNLGIGVGSNLTDAEISVLANQNNTNWTDFIFQKGATQNRQVGISYGGENATIYTSFGHTKQEGIVRNTGLERYSFRSNITAKSKDDRFKFGLDFTAAYVRSDFTTNLGSGFVFFNPLVGALWGQPFLNPYRPDGTVNDDSFDEFQPLSASPYVILNNFRYNPNVERTVKSVASANASYEIANGLTIGSRVGIDYFQSNTLRVIHPESTNRLFNPVDGELQGRQIEDFLGEFSINANGSLNYTNTFGKHTIDASIFAESYRLYRKSLGFTQIGLESKTFSPGDGDAFVDGNREENGNFLYIPSVRSNLGEGGLFSYFTIIDYDFDNRFGLTGTLRRDASFRFSSTNRWGTFYSLSGRWNLDEEGFMNSASNVSELKLRASYGVTGSERVGGDDFLSAASASRTLFATGTGYNNSVGLFIGSLGNDDLKWETVTQTNIGLDYGFFNNRIRGSIDVYNKRTDDLFLANPISAVNGQYSINSNQGSLQNRGVEFSTNYNIITGPDLSISLFGNVSYNENEVLELVGGDIDNGATIVAEGHPLGSYYLVPYVGVNPNNGNALYRTKEGGITEEFNANDRVIMDGILPKVQGGFGANIAYKGFYLDSNFSFVTGVKRYNDQQRFFQSNPFEALNFNVSQNYNRAWTPENRITDVEGLFSRQNNFGSDKFLHDSSYLRLRYVAVGYNFSEEILDKLPFIKSLRVYVQGENLLTWSKWEGLDVEANIQRNFDFSDYPTPRIFTAGIDVKL